MGHAPGWGRKCAALWGAPDMKKPRQATWVRVVGRQRLALREAPGRVGETKARIVGGPLRWAGEGNV